MDSFQFDYGSYLINIGLLIGLLALLSLASIKLARKSGIAPSPVRNRRLQVVDQLTVEPRKSLYLVKCGSRHWLLGCSDQGWQPIGEVSETDAAITFDEALEQAHEEPTLPEWVSRWFKRPLVWLGLLCLLMVLCPGAEAAPNPLDSFDLRAPIASKELSTPIQLIFFLAFLTVLPFMFMMTTTFLRTAIVLSFLRSAMGTQQVPPNQVIIGLALFLTIYTMSPVWDKMNTDALQPFLAKQIPQSVAMDRASRPLKTFMLKQVGKQDLAFFVRIAKVKQPRTAEDLPLHVVIPAFMTSELATAFKIGFLIFLPFLVVDLVVANTLLALGMMMLSPVTISMPFKLLIFTLANGWTLIIQSIVKSFQF